MSIFFFSLVSGLYLEVVAQALFLALCSEVTPNHIRGRIKPGSLAYKASTLPQPQFLQPKKEGLLVSNPMPL